jgi:putative oxidoreductase
MIVLGWKTRVVAVLLVLFTAVSTFLYHDFWTLPEGAQRASQLTQALKNLSIIGGFLLLAGAGPGRLSLDGAARPRV